MQLVSMFFCANAATFGPGLEEEPDFTTDGPERPAATKGTDHGFHGFHGWERKTRNLEGRKQEFLIREIREICGKIFAGMKDFFL
jgi:hypothetical protein